MGAALAVRVWIIRTALQNTSTAWLNAVRR